MADAPASPTSTAPRPAPAAAPLLDLGGVCLRAGGRLLVDGLDLQLAAGERLVVVGGNGSGKSTLLHVLAGLREPDGGSVRRPPDPPGMLFQDGGLWPHLSVARHLAFVDTRDDVPWRRQLLDTFRLTSLADRRPDALSGGERLRLALARALAGRPRWLLLDEPLAHLDPELALAAREVLPLLIDELGAACVFVTHDPEDVLVFGTRLLELSGRGRTWLGPARVALEAPPTAGLAAFSGRGTLFTAVADAAGACDFGLGLRLEACTPGATVTAFLDAHAVLLAEDGFGLPARYVAPDRRGGSWLRVDERLLRSADGGGPAQPGDLVHVRVEGRLRVLEPGA